MWKLYKSEIIHSYRIGLVGTPADMINVRMQNDIKLPAEQRRK